MDRKGGVQLYCNKCGKELEENQTFCTKCGARLNERDEPKGKGSSAYLRRILDVS